MTNAQKRIVKVKQFLNVTERLLFDVMTEKECESMAKRISDSMINYMSEGHANNEAAFAAFAHEARKFASDVAPIVNEFHYGVRA